MSYSNEHRRMKPVLDRRKAFLSQRAGWILLPPPNRRRSSKLEPLASKSGEHPKIAPKAGMVLL